MEITNELVEQLKACTTVEDVQAFAQANGVGITDEQAVTMLKMMDEHRGPEEEGKISDDALADVAGGFNWWNFAGGFLITAVGVVVSCVLYPIVQNKINDDLKRMEEQK